MQNDKQREEKQQESVRAVDRALEILLAFQPGDQELMVAQLLTRVISAVRRYTGCSMGPVLTRA